MAVSFQIDPIKFLTPVLGSVLAHQIIDAGVTFEFSMYSAKAMYQGKSAWIASQKSVTKVAAGGLDAANTKILAANISKALEKIGYTGKIPSVGGLVDTEKKNVDALTVEDIKTLLGNKAKVEIKVKPAAQPVNAVIPLIQATALGQKVKGTNAESVYRAIALGKTVKVAVRLQGSSLSLRAEGPFKNSDKVALTTMGFKESTQGHWSSHFDLQGVPLERVVGGVLLANIDFDDKVQSAKQLKETLNG